MGVTNLRMLKYMLNVRIKFNKLSIRIKNDTSYAENGVKMMINIEKKPNRLLVYKYSQIRL